MKRSGALFALLLLGLLIAGAVVGLRRFLADDEIALARQRAEELARESDAQARFEARRFDPGPDDPVVVDASSPLPLPDEVLDGPRGLLRLIGPDGEPVVGAAVHFVGRRRVAAFTARESRSISPELVALAPRIGLSDERGELAIRSPRGEGLLVALKDELFGSRSCGRDGEVHDPAEVEMIFANSRARTVESRLASGITTIRLDRFDTVEVEVRDEDGAPLADAPLRLVDGRDPSSRAWIALGYKGRWSEMVRTSRPNGRARLLVPRSRDGRSDLSVELAGFFADRVAARVTDEHRSGGVLVLTAPPRAAIEVLLVDAEGRRVRAPGLLRVGVSNRPTSTQPFDLRGGSLVVAPVGLDLPLDLRFEPLDQSLGSPGVEHRSGPTRPGELLQIEIPLDPHGVSVAALCVAPDGRPLVDQEIHARIGRRSVVNRTDAQGRVAFGLDSGRLRVVGANDLTLRWMSSGSLAGEHRGTVDLPLAGRVDLGEVRFERPPLLVSGRLVDDLGRPLDGVAPRATVFDDDDRGGSTRHLDDATMTRTMTNGDGRFEILGLGEGPDVQVTVEPPGHVEQRIVVPRGTTDLLITAPRIARLRGRLLPPPALEGREIQLWVQDDEGKRRKIGLTAKDGRFDLALEPGRLAALRAALPESVAGDMRLDAMRAETMREDLVLAPGATLDIGDNALSIPARYLRIEILDARLLPARDARLVIEDVETGVVARKVGLRGGTGRYEFLVPRLPVALAIAAPGIRFEKVRVATTEARLRVRPSTRLVVEVLDFEGLRHDQDATLLLIDEDGMGEVETVIELDHRGRGEALIPTTGPHALVLRVHRMFGTWNDEHLQIVPERPDSIQILDGVAEQRLRVRLPKGALGNASRSLKED